MSDIIQLLPDNIANQIAAGEVIQRPASAVKELLENAIDAGATRIELIIKDAGKTLIQVVDNGCGMSSTDARLSFERHATSKITNANDLFSINTLGFRGEALASIAAIAQVELKTKQQTAELGTQLIIEGSTVKMQEPCQCNNGTSFAIKNLFYNVPARRKFLKSNAVETRHIIDEFQRVALANPKIYFSLHNNNIPVFQLPASNLRKRIIGLLGHSFNDRLVSLEEDTDFLRIYGFIGKPQFARKTRGEQFLFVNERFIKSAYLNHAIVKAYNELLQPKTYPLYIIYMDIDPARIDVNVHPTKQEIKFDDEKLVYAFIQAAVKRALGKHSLTPSLDFDRDINLTNPFNSFPKPSTKMGAEDGKGLSAGKTTAGKSHNSNNSSGGGSAKWTGSSNFPSGEQPAWKKRVPDNWEELYKTGVVDFPKAERETKNGDFSTEETITIQSDFSQPNLGFEDNDDYQDTPFIPVQLHHCYIVWQIKSGFILLQQQLVHERILFENYLNALDRAQVSTQKLLFPQTIELTGADADLLKEILPDINALGYDVQEFGQNTFVVHGAPSDVKSTGDEQQVIESLIEQFKLNLQAFKLDKRTNLAKAMARKNAIKIGQKLSVEEMRTLVDQLFGCETPYISPSGRPTFTTYPLAEIAKQFERKNG